METAMSPSFGPHWLSAIQQLKAKTAAIEFLKEGAACLNEIESGIIVSDPMTGDSISDDFRLSAASSLALALIRVGCEDIAEAAYQEVISGLEKLKVNSDLPDESTAQKLLWDGHTGAQLLTGSLTAKSDRFVKYVNQIIQAVTIVPGRTLRHGGMLAHVSLADSQRVLTVLAQIPEDLIKAEVLTAALKPKTFLEMSDRGSLLQAATQIISAINTELEGEEESSQHKLAYHNLLHQAAAAYVAIGKTDYAESILSSASFLCDTKPSAGLSGVHAALVFDRWEGKNDQEWWLRGDVPELLRDLISGAAEFYEEFFPSWAETRPSHIPQIVAHLCSSHSIPQVDARENGDFISHETVELFGRMLALAESESSSAVKDLLFHQWEVLREHRTVTERIYDNDDLLSFLMAGGQESSVAKRVSGLLVRLVGQARFSDGKRTDLEIVERVTNVANRVVALGRLEDAAVICAVLQNVSSVDLSRVCGVKAIISGRSRKSEQSRHEIAEALEALPASLEQASFKAELQDAGSHGETHSIVEEFRTRMREGFDVSILTGIRLAHLAQVAHESGHDGECLRLLRRCRKLATGTAPEAAVQILHNTALTSALLVNSSLQGNFSTSTFPRYNIV